MYRTSLSPYSKTTSSYIGSTSPTRITSYLEALERDETISNLRRQYSHHRSIQREYEDLQYEISKAERESKKLEQQNLQIQQDYMDKIKCNKGLISELGSQIQEVEMKIKNTSNNGTNKQAFNEKLIDDLKETKAKISDCEEDNKKIQKNLESQQAIAVKLNETLDELMTKKKQTQNLNKTQSQVVDEEFNEYKTLQERVKAEEAINLELKQELSLLKGKKSKLQLRVEQVQQKMKDLKKKYDNCEFESERLGARCHEAEKQSSKVYAEALTLKQNIEQSLTKNKDHTGKLKSLQVVLKQNINGLCVKHTTKQKMAVELSDISKDIEKAVSIIKALDEQTEEQEANNKGLISNLKKSIQSDEQAVKALTRKAAILNLISQS